ncbi:GL12595 [Drosophila persimilis]|uniref:GL12595 n=1 Tax=Drosophila persimilis TaxID=7234 RepID=B4H3I5_DROPE|nr:GL12595 [Drosophila persimilis]
MSLPQDSYNNEPIGDWQKLKLLLWKNWTLQWNQKIQLMFALALPVLFLLLIVTLRVLVEPVSMPVVRYPPVSISDMNLFKKSVIHGNLIMHDNGSLNIPKNILCYTPDSSVNRAIITAATMRLRLLSWRSYDTASHMEYDLITHNYLAGVEFEILLGQNGAGKTTTIHMLTGIIQPSDGTAFLNGYDIRHQLASARRSLGICPQQNILFNNMTVRDHIKFFSKLKGVRGSTAVNWEVSKYMRLMELEDKSRIAADKLSGGMKRKLSLCCALCGNTSIVLCDEASAGVDAAGRRSLWELLQAEKIGRTVLLTTHYMDEADVLGDRIAILCDAALPLSYTLSSFFSDGATGFTRTVIATTLTGTGLFMLVLALSFEAFQLKHIAVQLAWYFRVFPHYCLASAVHHIHIGFNIRRGCNFAAVRKLPRTVRCRTVPVCCNISGYFGWRHPGVLPEIAYLSAVATFLLLLLMIVDAKMCTCGAGCAPFKLLCSIGKRRRTKDQSNFDNEDVKKENFFIKNMTLSQRKKMPLLVDGISKRYGKYFVVKDLSFYVTHAECFGLLGINGAGKDHNIFGCSQAMRE